LLLEFNNAPFMLQSRQELTPQISQNALSSKLALLVLQFPKLRIFWSRDTAQSVNFCVALRKGGAIQAGGPNLERIMASGVNNVRKEQEDGIVDATPRILLSRLPGVFAGNIDATAAKAKTLQELLTKFDKKEYAAVMGAQNAKKLEAFIKRRYKEDE
jgi:DNA excision repair protein ERCC-4